MSYKSALIAAGAEVLNFEYFGFYSGQWFAQVRYNGETGWIQGTYGSCSYCDSYEADFGYPEDDENDEEYQKRLADFGRSYLSPLPASHFLPSLDTDSEWDGDAEEAADWIRKIEGVM